MAEGGKRVRWGVLFRSGALTNLTSTGLSQLCTLGIRTVCDFRTHQERQREPAPPLGEVVRYLSWDYDASPVSVRAFFSRTPPSAQSAEQSMLQLYRAMPMHLTQLYAGLFRSIAGGRTPLIFGCAAGKDRTGVAAALLLLSLGTSRDDILEDFALTDKAVDLERHVMASGSAGAGLDGPSHWIAGLLPEVRAPFLRADPAYLEAALAAIDSGFGSVDGYLHRALSVSEQDVASIRDRMLES